ncbi:hypothetical protein ZOSMA_9G01410 [Zostera marina]|uniref:Tubulin alpha-6 chain n=1 Tax=Zostera marina TaxID=29655 RepID=A0A0K9NIX3_ZOSMR|nr:hypothetical protein ZOSMA_9G01410 [Zostera marina]
MLMGLVFLPSSSYLRECDSKAFTMSTLLHIGRPGISSEIMGIRLQNRRRSKKFISFRCGPTKNDDELSPSEEAAESMFMKELRRRGMESEDQRKTTESKSNGEPSSDYDDKKLENQREVSMSLNSEGLEGLIPRAKLLLSLGGTFFLAFGPLILITITLFTALYFYFGPTFIHGASTSSFSPPQFVDPYQLLEDDKISRMTSPPLK